MSVSGIAAAEIIFRIEYDRWFAPDQLLVVAHFQRRLALDSIIRARGRPMLPVRFVAGRGVKLAIIKQTKATPLPAKDELEQIAGNLDILRLNCAFCFKIMG